jgi:undecaprenyl-diphosphatase
VALWLAWRWFSANRDALTELVYRHWALFRERHPGVARFIAARFVRGEYLGLHLTIGFLVSLVALWLFAAVTEDVLHNDPLTKLDLTFLAWIRAHTTPFGDKIFTIVSLIGSPLAMTVVAAVGALLIIVRRKWFLLFAWAVAFMGAGVLSFFLKLLIQRPRPIGASAFLHGETFSFPSGHALGSLVGYGMFAYVIGSTWIETARARLVLVVATAVLVIAIGVSRLYLGVHYFSDVVGGYAVGVLWLSVCISGLQVAERRRPIG